MGDHANPISSATEMTETTANSANTADETAADLVWVCRSAMLPRAAYHFYRALLLVFPERGGPPDSATLRWLAQRFGIGLEATLARLAAEDLVQRDPATGAIRAAYPFSGVPTAHRVTLLGDPGGTPDVQVYAMCALDALGIPLMLLRPALVTSVDPLTREAVHVRVWQANADAAEVTESGLPGWRSEWDPATAVVYARPEDPMADAADIAAACRCPVTNFFSAPAQARRWAERHGAPGDLLLASAQALHRAERRFGGLLDRLSGIDGQGARP
jgi:hypothetical protein